jgi:aminoglycoside phosphotransferase (APT) family kinase protein
LPHDAGAFSGLHGLDLQALGIPEEAAFLTRYCEAVGRPVPHAEWNFFLAFSLFRSAAIGQGVYDRSRRGNAADARAHLYQDMMQNCARVGWAIAERK